MKSCQVFDDAILVFTGKMKLNKLDSLTRYRMFLPLDAYGTVYCVYISTSLKLQNNLFHHIVIEI